MADFTLNAPGSTNDPWSPANILVLASTIKSDATGFRAETAGVAAIFAHNSAYGSTITTTCTIAAGATSNGDQLWVGAVVKTGANKGGGLGIFLDSVILAAGWWNTSGSTFTKLTASDTTITRANNDVWSVTITLSGGTFTIGSVTQNGASRTLNGAPITTTQYGSESSIAAGMELSPGNNDSLYLSQFTGTGVSGPPPTVLMGGMCL